MAKAMLIDTDLCLDCNACSVECKNNNQVPIGNDIAWTRIDEFETGQFPDINAYFVKRACHHCTEASCLNNCPVGAISKPDGTHVVIDQDKCISCGMCATVCPFGIPHYGEPRGKAQKCRFCYGTKPDDASTACASACPFGAISFGERTQLIEAGRKRVTQLVAKGKVDANLYGENELGGLNVLYVLADKPSVFGLPETPSVNGSKEPVVVLPQTGDIDLAPVVLGAAGVGAVATVAGVSWVIRRRMSQGKSEEKT